MSTRGHGTAAVTGANGYLGAIVAERLGKEGWQTLRLVRTERGETSRRFVLGAPVQPELLEGIDLVVHCAYDMALRQRADIWRVNVAGTANLLEAARAAGVGRVIVLSSMSAFEGTTQLYGQAKLQIEAHAQRFGACSVRPGLVYGPRAGGMAGTLQRLSRMPFVPLVGGTLVPVHGPRGRLRRRDRRPRRRARGADRANWYRQPCSRALPADTGPFRSRPRAPVPFRPGRLAPRAGRVRLGERTALGLPVRSDSLLGLVRPAPLVPNLAGTAVAGDPLAPLRPAGPR